MVKKLVFAIVAAASLALFQTSCSKKETVNPSTTTPITTTSGIAVSAETKSDVGKVTSSTKKATAAREKASKATKKLNARLAYSFRSDSIPGDTTGFGGNPTFPGGNLGGSTPGGNMDGLPLDSLGDISGDLEKELGGNVTITQSGNNFIMTIDYGTGTANPDTIGGGAPILKGKMSMVVGMAAGASIKITFDKFGEDFTNDSLDTEMSGSMTTSVPADENSAIITEMDISIKEGSEPTLTIKGTTTVTSTLTSIVENSTLTIKQADEEFTVVSKDVTISLVEADLSKAAGYPISGTQTITTTVDGKAVTIEINYGDGKTIDDKATVKVDGLEVDDDLDLSDVAE
jgi:hypothetical protein